MTTIYSHLLNQARKYRLGLIFAHQNLDQLGAGLRSSVLASTTIKFAGGLSAKDANTLDTEMRCSSDFLLAQRKEREHTEFACFIKNYTMTALSVQIPLGFVESLPTLAYEEYQELVDNNRAQYSAPPMITPPTPVLRPQPPPASPAVAAEAQPTIVEPTHQPVAQPEVVVPLREETVLPAVIPPPIVAPTIDADKPKKRKVVTPGVGGKQHKYLQHLIKNLAEARGFKASIEEIVLDGAGRVDVSVTSDTIKVAFEISVTTSGDQELGNIEKCFAAGYSHIFLVGDTERHVKTLSTFIEDNLDEHNQGKVRYVSPTNLPECIETLPIEATKAKTIRGYKVKVSRQVLSPEEVDSRRASIARVIAKSLDRTKE